VSPPPVLQSPPSRIGKGLERLAIVLVSLALTIGVIALLSGGLLAGRDDPGLSTGQTGPGTAFGDQGDRHLTAGAPRPHYDSSPPTSGPHVPVAVTRDRAQLSDDQVLEALEVGDVVLMYGSPSPPAQLAALARSQAGTFTPALAATGQAVILARRPGTDGITALAWAHLLRARSAADPALRGFAQYWLGRGATASDTRPSS